MMQPPDPAELAAAPEITLGRRRFKVVELVPTQNEIVTPAIFDLFEVFIRAKMAAADGNLLGMKLTTEQYRKLISICAIAISRAQPDVTLDTLNGLPIKTLELIAAFVVIARQAGVVPEEVPAAVAVPLAGQPSTTAPAATEEAQQTGELSPSRSPSEPAGTLTTSEALSPPAASS